MENFDLIIIGGGPGGYRCAEMAASGGLSVALFEKRALGGVCLNEGCIPTKALLNCAKLYRHAGESALFGVTAGQLRYDHGAAIERKNGVTKTLTRGVASALAAKKVKVINETAQVAGKSGENYQVAAGNETYTAKRLCLATGSESVVPPIPGVKEGLDSGFVMTNREILDMTALPESLVCIGGGVIGLEMACYFASVGVKVTVIELMEKIAGPVDAEICQTLMAEYQKRGMDFKLKSRVTKITPGMVEYEENGETKTVKCEKILLSAGRRASFAGIELENIGVLTDKTGIVTDKQMRTNIANVYAVGDCNGKSMLAHTAYREAEVAANHMLGLRDEMRYEQSPSVIYTDPEVACAGDSLASATEKGLNAREIKIPLYFSGRYLAENDNGTGFLKMIVDRDTKRVLGLHMLGSYASEIIIAAVLMLDTEQPVTQLKKLVFPHPTVGEAIKEALFKA